MQIRLAISADASTLAELNQQLICDEGHRNSMTLPELEARMSNWLAGEYEAHLFAMDGQTMGYVLARREPEYCYIRQFFIAPEFRRRGLGRAAFAELRRTAWSDVPRFRMDVLVGNERAIEFWRSLGFRDYCLTMECE